MLDHRSSPLSASLPASLRVSPLLALASAAGLASAGCDLIQSAEATTITAGMIVATPEVKLAGQFDVKSETVATAYVGVRKSATSTAEPTPITGATVTVDFGGASVPLTEQMDPKGFYMTTSLDAAGLTYVDGGRYTFTSKLPGDTAAFGGSVTAPTRLTDAALTLTPTPGTLPMVDGVRTHPKNTELEVQWQAQAGHYAYVSVFRADPANPDRPQLVFDNRPQTASQFLQFVVGTPPSSITIPASAFSDDAGYAVVIVTLDKGDPKTNTFLGSPILAGSGVAELLAVGTFRP